MLIAARVIQGAGGALLSATAAAMVTAAYPPSERGRALGFMTMWVYIGLTVGPLVGGLIVQHLTWPNGRRQLALDLLREHPGRASRRWRPAGRSCAPSSRTGSAPGRRRRRRSTSPAPPCSACMLAAFIVPLTFGFTWGWGSPLAIGLLVVGRVAAVAFVATEGASTIPLLDLDLLRHNRLFATANLAALLNYAAMNAVTVLTAVFLQVVQHRPPQDAGAAADLAADPHGRAVAGRRPALRPDRHAHPVDSAA